MCNNPNSYISTRDDASIVDGTPYDGVPREKIVTAHIAVVVIIYIFAAAGVIFSIVCLTFNFAFRNTKYIILLYTYRQIGSTKVFRGIQSNRQTWPKVSDICS